MKTKYFRITLAICLSLLAGTAISTKAQKAELVIERTSAYPVHSVSFSPDGKTLASESGDHIKLWDVEGGKELRTLTGHSHSVASVAFSSDGTTLASGSFDNTIKLWDVETGKELRTLTGHSDPVDSVAFSPDGKTLASGSLDYAIKLWDVETGKELRTLTGHSSIVNSVSFSSDGKTLVSGSHDNTIRLWDVKSGRELKTIAGVSSFDSVLFSPGGKILASGDSDHTVKLWYAETGKELRTLKGHAWTVNSVSFGPDGKTLASGSIDGTTKIWDVETGKELRTFTGHSWSVNSVSFSPDGRTLASGSADETIKLWNVATGEEICSLIALDDYDWVVTAPDGRFESNKNLDSTESLYWEISDDPMTSLPLGSFMRDYFEPKLLSRLIKCTKEKNCDQEFRPRPNIAELNRVQPPVKITRVSPMDANRSVTVTVEVGKGTVPQKECQMKRCETGAYDLRLFRDGQIVGTYPGVGQAELNKQNESLKTSIAEKDMWRKVSNIKLEKKAGCKTGAAECTTQTFDVELPNGKNAADIEFTAYAFNEDRVKSQIAIYRWTNQQKGELPNVQAVKR